MNWFQRWPKDALIAVSNHFLANYDIVCTPDVKQAVLQTMGEFQVRLLVEIVRYIRPGVKFSMSWRGLGCHTTRLSYHVPLAGSHTFRYSSLEPCVNVQIMVITRLPHV